MPFNVINVPDNTGPAKLVVGTFGGDAQSGGKAQQEAEA